MRNRFFKIVGVGLFYFFILSFSSTASPWRDDRPTTMGHRGTPMLEDENTMAAFKAAYDHGLDMFECDPKLTKDGIYVIMHDDTVDRTTDGIGPVSEMTFEEVRKLRTKAGHRVPTLEEALTFARERDMNVYLDIKDPPEDGGALLVKVIRDAGMTERVVAGCWHKETVRMIEEIAPEISTCISWPWPALTMGQARRLGVDAVGTLKGLASKFSIRLAHKKGLKMVTMPINTGEDLEKFNRRGLDAFQSDDPRLLEPYGKQPK
jgi:glycerophosphoryl diester phosphodiesterase